MPKTYIRWLFLGVLLLLMAQVLIAKWDEEPYPAVMFPGFGQVIPVDQLYPYQYERLVLRAHTPTDTLPISLKALLAPFPEAYPEDALLAPIRTKLRNLADPSSPLRDTPEDQALSDYLRQQTRQQLGDTVQRLELTVCRYRAEPDGRVALVDVTHRRTWEF